MEEAENGARKRSPTRDPGNGARKLSPSPTRENGVRKISSSPTMENGVRRQRSPTRGPGNGARKLSPSPTRSPGSEQRKTSASPPTPPPPPVPRWLILDRIVHRCSRRRSGVVQEDATASALAHDCVGRAVRASLRIADPPAVSRLYIHGTVRQAIRGLSEPAAIAAHSNSILFRMTIPFDDRMLWGSPAFFPVDYFVYSCASSSSPPSLTLLPPCFHGGGAADPKIDEFFPPYRNQHQRIMLSREMGILCHGDDDGEFTVADLTQRFREEVDLCLLHHPPPAASAIPVQWSVQRLKIPPDMKINLFSWNTDVVIPITVNRCLCWIDYYQGMLLVDVLTDSENNPGQELLHYIPLPSEALQSRRLYKDPGDPDPLRCVCATDAGIIVFVCILTKRPPSPDPFTIKIWTLDDVHQGTWTMDDELTVGAEAFFGLLSTGHSCLPRVRPSFPVVSLVDPDVICFLLEDKDCGLFWMIEVNMRNKKLQSSALYINEEEEEGYPPKRDRRNRFFGHYFIPSKFSSYLSEDAITSWKLSETMQKEKEKRVLQSGLEVDE